MTLQTCKERVMAAEPALRRSPWNKDKIVGQKAPFKLKEIWAIRIRLQLAERLRELALFNLGIDSKLRACDLVKLRVRDVCHGERVAMRVIVIQQKTRRPVQFEITDQTRRHWRGGSAQLHFGQMTFYSQIADCAQTTFRRGSIREPSDHGRSKLDSIHRCTRHTQ